METDSLDASSNPGSTPFIITVLISRSSPTVTLRTNPNLKYNYNVDCKTDGVLDVVGATGDYVCTFPNAKNYQKYTISIFDNTGRREGFPQATFQGDLQAINQWGTGKWKSFAKAFKGNFLYQGAALTFQIYLM